MRLGPEDFPRLEAEWREFLVRLRVRIPLPRPGERRPDWVDTITLPIDTGGASLDWYRPRHVRQDPASDPREPGGGESSSAGYDHGWSNCTMSSGACVLDHSTQGRLQLWGGDLRHAPGQPDLEGGTDLYDVQKAWLAYGEALDVRSGRGWDAVRADREAGHAIILTGEGNVPGAASFTGGHAIALLPEPDEAGRWLIGDPLSSGFEWVGEAELRQWAERLDEDVNWARGQAHLPAGGAEDVSFNIAPVTTHRDAIVRDGAVLYSDSALSLRYSVATGDTGLGFVGSTNTAHVVVNGQNTNYVDRADVLKIVPKDRTFE